MTRDDLEEVSIETVHVGDYVYVESERAARCVLSKATTRLAQTDKVAGWRVELMSSSPMWLPRRAMVMRRRFGSVATAHAVRKAG